MKVAAVQMMAEVANVEKNMDKARTLAEKAFRSGAEWVILPEFFTSAVGFSRKMKHAALTLEGPAMDLLKALAAKHNGVAGGSYISWKNNDCYNTFVLPMPESSKAACPCCPDFLTNHIFWVRPRLSTVQANNWPGWVNLTGTDLSQPISISNKKIWYRNRFRTVSGFPTCLYS